MKNFLSFVLLFFLLALLSGCADKSQIVRDINSDLENQSVQLAIQVDSTSVDLLLEPVDTVGLLLTPAIRERKAKFYEVIFPEILFLGEIFPERIKWYGWGIGENGSECLAQLLFIYKVRLDNKLVAVIAVDNPNAQKVIGFSTRMDYVYSLDHAETEVSASRGKIATDSGYRKELGEKFGVEVSTLKEADYMYAMIENWHRVQGPRGEILTPLDEEKFLEVSRKNPAYTWSQKWVEKFSGSVYIDPVATGMNAFFETITAAGVKSQGWDFAYNGNSRVMALKAKYLIDMKFRGMQEMMARIIAQKKGGGVP